jgi:hypothetical protein
VGGQDPLVATPHRPALLLPNAALVVSRLAPIAIARYSAAKHVMPAVAWFGLTIPTNNRRSMAKAGDDPAGAVAERLIAHGSNNSGKYTVAGKPRTQKAECE